MQITIDEATLQRLGIGDGREYYPVPFEAFDTVDLGAASATLTEPLELFKKSVAKGDQYKNFSFGDNANPLIITAFQFLHNADFADMSSATTDNKLIQDYFEKHSYFKFGLDEKPIFTPRMSTLVPWTRVPENGTVITTEKENDWYTLPYPLEIPKDQVGECTLIIAQGLTLTAGGVSLAAMPILYNYPTKASPNASHYHCSGVFTMKGVRFVKR